ncbi:MAG: lactate racemase domain-containing protein [Candidatus Hermodarchaeota archaeon]
MVQTFNIPWAAWYGDKDLQIEFPDTWDVNVYKMQDTVELSEEDIKNALNKPIGTPTIRKIAKGKSTAVIAVEDISRPIQAEFILEIVLNQLNKAGIPNDRITLIYALGAHRPMNRIDSIKKVGAKNVDKIKIENHHPYENLVYIGDSYKGTPIYLNKTYHDAEVKISISSVVPHPLAGYGGGAKVVLPGLCGIQTLEANHEAGVRGIGVGLGIVTELRKDIEDTCRKVGLDFSINVIPTMARKIGGIFVGDFIEAHRKAMEMAEKVYSTTLPPKLNLDIGFFNLYPEDTELSQAIKGLNFYLKSKSFIKREGAVVLMTAASEGRGYHSLLGETGGKLYKNWGDSVIFKAVLKHKKFCLFSQNVNKRDVMHYYPETTIFHTNFQELVKNLEKIYGNTPKIGIFPSSNQLPKKN